MNMLHYVLCHVQLRLLIIYLCYNSNNDISLWLQDTMILLFPLLWGVPSFDRFTSTSGLLYSNTSMDTKKNTASNRLRSCL